MSRSRDAVFLPTLVPEVNKLSEIEGLGWITALKGGQIRSLVEGEALQLGLFDERNRASLRNRHAK